VIAAVVLELRQQHHYAVARCQFGRRFRNGNARSYVDDNVTPGSGRLRRLAVSVLVFPAIALLGIVGAVLAHGSLRTASGLLALNAVLAAMYAAIQSQLILRTAVEGAARSLENEISAHELFGDVVAKAMPPLAELVTTPPGGQPDGRMSNFITLLVGLAYGKCAKSSLAGANIRCVLYGLSTDGMTLTRYTSEGLLGDAPRLEFKDVDGNVDRSAVELARGDQAVLHEDLGPSDKGYRSRAASPVNAGTVRYGLFTVDSDVPGSLTDLDLKIVIFLARCLAGAIAHLGGSVAEFPGHNGGTESGSEPSVPVQYVPTDTTGTKESSNGKNGPDVTTERSSVADTGDRSSDSPIEDSRS
jgi:hypothetical protein